ncbi:MAG: aliphatic sulfonate ABC transporter substrate-binding protein [Deltaproteobacteria bacterium]|nr:aliphatic sulfonate ABC transporter substrate-binding protein [Deltaproteobacteria bacterium]
MVCIRRKTYIDMIKIIVLIFLASFAVKETFAEEIPKEFVIGYQSYPTPEIVVKEMGWIEKELDIQVKWVEFDSGYHVNKALASESIDVGLVGTSPCAAAISQGIPIQVIWIHDVIGKNEALVVKKGQGIKKTEDLIGKRVAVPLGSTTHYHLMIALKLANVNPKKVKTTYLEPEDMYSAWTRNEIDGGFVWEPSRTKMLDKGGKILLTSLDLAEKGYPTANLGVVRKTFARKYPSIIEKYLTNLDRAVKLCLSQPNQAAAVVVKQLGGSPDKVNQQMKSAIFLTGEEQIAGKYVGGMHWGFGMYRLLKETADFLEQERVIKKAGTWPAFMWAVNSAFLERALKK